MTFHVFWAFMWFILEWFVIFTTDKDTKQTDMNERPWNDSV